jgi:hypothetical protein
MSEVRTPTSAYKIQCPYQVPTGLNLQGQMITISMNRWSKIRFLVNLSPAYSLFCCNNQSTASFFQDNSVSLAQLMGFRSRDKGRLYFPNSLRFEERNKKQEKGSCSHCCKVQGSDVSRVICIPVLLDTLLKIRKSKKSSRN